MNTFDFQARAALYLGSDWHQASAQGARNFRTAAQAILFAIEHAAPVSLHGARLIVGDVTYSGDQLAGLYRNPDFPLPRRIDAQQPRTARRKKRGSSVQRPYAWSANAGHQALALA